MQQNIQYERYIKLLFNHFIRMGCHPEKMHEYFGFTNTTNNIRKICLEMDPENNQRATLIIESYKREADVLDCYIHGLPRELNNIIYSYLVDIRKMKHLIELPNHYPFIEPTWTLIKYSVNGTSKKEEEDEKDKIFCGGGWTPALKLDKEILSYVSTLDWL